MKRRHLLATAGAAATLAACSKGTPESDMAVHNWKLVTSWQGQFPVLAAAAERLAEQIGIASAGRLRVQVYAGNELVAPFEVFDAVSSGQAEMGHSAAYYWRSKSPAAPFFCAVPFGLNAQEMNAWLQHGGGMSLWRELYARYNLVPFAAGNTGVQMAGWFNRELTSVADLKGLKMRIPGLGGEVMSRLGTQAVNLPGAEIASAMQSGAIDACEWLGPHNDEVFGLFRVAKYCYYPGWQEPGPTLECIVNQPAFDSLPADLQAVVELCCRALNDDMLAEFTARNQSALKHLREEYRVEFRRLPDSILVALREASEQLLRELVGDDGLARRVLESFTAFRDQARAWHAISEIPYYQARE